MVTSTKSIDRFETILYLAKDVLFNLIRMPTTLNNFGLGQIMSKKLVIPKGKFERRFKKINRNV